MSPGRKQSAPVNRNQVARIVFASAESMGIRDRKLVEKLTTQVIERLERVQADYLPTLPGMEDLVDKRSRLHKPLPSEAEIEAMVKEVLNAAQPVPAEEVKPDMENTTDVTHPKEPISSVDLTETARKVLERRYLTKDKLGNTVETPEEMFRR
ncbi:MAG: hypothetical protein MUO19_00550, partial [Dehalococcoidales bacterium]|nr:hypothetical protein [Dehalococcoidales bacterium]